MFQEDNYRHIIEQLIPFHRVIGLQLQEMRAGFASLLIPYREDLVGDPRIKRIHGGVISTALDAVGGAAGMTTLNSAKDQISTVDIHIDYLYPGRPEDIVVEGEISRNGNSLIFTRMFAHHPGDDKPLAQARAVYRVKRIQPDEA